MVTKISCLPEIDCDKIKRDTCTCACVRACVCACVCACACACACVYYIYCMYGYVYIHVHVHVPYMHNIIDNNRINFVSMVYLIISQSGPLCGIKDVIDTPTNTLANREEKGHAPTGL